MSERKEASTMPSATQSDTQRPPPSDTRVLGIISEIDGDGATAYEIQNGSRIHFWYGFPFQAAGTTYYTGFAWITPEKYGEARAAGIKDPEAPVTLAHATFVAEPAGAAEPWSLLGSEPWIGTFGRGEQGNAVDPSREPVVADTATGQLLLAVPSVDGDRPSAEILVFDPHPLQGIDARKWAHLGTVPMDVGSRLAFVPRRDGALPDIAVSLENAVSSAHTLVHAYDPQSHAYRPVPR